MSAFLGWLATTSLQVAALVLFLLLAERLLGPRLRPRWRYALWLVVLARLFLPGVSLPGAPWDWTLASLRERDGAALLEQERPSATPSALAEPREPSPERGRRRRPTWTCASTRWNPC